VILKLKKMPDLERDYKSTDLPTIDEDKVNNRENQVELLKVVYGETNSNYRNLADIRFKLLGFVPAISVLAWATLYKDIGIDSLANVISGIVITFLGLRVTYGIRTYDKRNDELYNDLVSRGRKIEEELGIHTALFKGRVKANKFDIFNRKINHGMSLNIIYSSVYAGWGLLLMWYIYNLAILVFNK
jgi:hypothetical protein